MSDIDCCVDAGYSEVWFDVSSSPHSSTAAIHKILEKET